MIGDFDMKLTHKLARDYNKATKKKKGHLLTEYCMLAFPPIIVPVFKLDF